MSYDQCCARWGSECSYPTASDGLGHFCSEWKGHSGVCKCNCGAMLGKIAKPRGRHGLASMALAMAAAAVPRGGVSERPPLPASSRAREESRRASLVSRPDADQRIAAAQAKRDRKAAKRRPSPDTAARK